MKHGRSVTDLRAEIERQHRSKQDYIINTNQMKMDNNYIVFTDTDGSGEEDFPLTEVAHRQLAEYAGIPAKYYDRMKLQAPDLLAENVNHWFGTYNQNRLVRVLDHNVRAFLSDRYMVLDNYDLSQIVVPILAERQARIVSAEITETHLYIQAIFWEIEGEVKRDDIIKAGIIIRNSEVGLGAVRIEPLLYRLKCENGMIANDFAMKKFHLGSKKDGGEGDIYQLLSDETKMLDSKATLMKVRDILSAVVTEEIFHNKLLPVVQRAMGIPIDNPIRAIENVTNKYSLTEDEHNAVLKNTYQNEMSLWGIANAVTQYANSDKVKYDRTIQLQEIGWDMLSNLSLN